MKYISIPPSAFMKEALKTSDTTLVCFNEVEKDTTYQEKCLEFVKSGGSIWLDNGYYEERKNPTIFDLVDCAHRIKADVICLPDTEMRTNLRSLVMRYITLAKRTYNYKGRFMMCVYANNKDWEEDLLYFKILNSINGLDIIAIPYGIDGRKKDEFKRPYFLDIIEKEINVNNIHHKIHLFGCNSLQNLKRENRWWIDTIDGTMPFKCGLYKVKLPISIKKEPKRPEKYFEIDYVNKIQQRCIDYNFKYIKKLCERRITKNES